MRTIEWSDEKNCITLIDQTKLPKELKIIECVTIEAFADAIKQLKVRGAPALGAAGAFGIALSANRSNSTDLNSIKREIQAAAEALKKTRPTAVNLFYGIERVLNLAKTGETVDEVKSFSLDEAQKIAREDVEMNKQLGKYGAALLEDGDTVMTHCNAGRMACVDWGSALGVIRSAIAQEKKIDVIACETRPLNQGSRITAWELMQDKIPVTLIVDSASGHVMKNGMIDKIIVGADRIVKDAVFNKIGTYKHAVLAKEHNIPFYVAAPVSTFDLERKQGDIVIEQRDADELRYFGNEQIAPVDVNVYNPAFDATPLELVTALITEKGVFYPPLKHKDIKALKN